LVYDRLADFSDLGSIAVKWSSRPKRAIPRLAFRCSAVSPKQTVIMYQVFFNHSSNDTCTSEI
jgi:hypothetical protein